MMALRRRKLITSSLAGVTEVCLSHRGLTVLFAETPANPDHVLLASDLRLTLLKARWKEPICQKSFDTALLTQGPDLQHQYAFTVQHKFVSSLVRFLRHSVTVCYCPCSL